MKRKNTENDNKLDPLNIKQEEADKKFDKEFHAGVKDLIDCYDNTLRNLANR